LHDSPFAGGAAASGHGELGYGLRARSDLSGPELRLGFDHIDDCVMVLLCPLAVPRIGALHPSLPLLPSVQRCAQDWRRN